MPIKWTRPKASADSKRTTASAPNADKPKGEKAKGDKPKGEKAKGDKPKGEKQAGTPATPGKKEAK